MVVKKEAWMMRERDRIVCSCFKVEVRSCRDDICLNTRITTFILNPIRNISNDGTYLY